MAFDYIIYDLKADLSSNSSFIADATNQREMHTLHLQIVCLSTCFYVVYIHFVKVFRVQRQLQLTLTRVSTSSQSFSLESRHNTNFPTQLSFMISSLYKLKNQHLLKFCQV